MKHLLTGVALVLLLASAAFAGTTTTGSSSLNTTVQLQATVTNAISFTLNLAGCVEAGSASGGPVTDYHIAFGNVDGLGFQNGAGACTPNLTMVTGATPGAQYMVPYTYTVHFAGFTNGTADVKAISNNTTSPVKIYESGVINTAGATPTGVVLDSTAKTIASAVSTGNSATRYIGLFVPESNTAAATAFSQTITFTVLPN